MDASRDWRPTMYTVTYCPCCGSMLRPGAACSKKCGVEPVSGTMSDAIAQQGVYLAQQAARAPAKTTAPAKPVVSGRVVKPYWQRPCTCGHCMACIGEA